MRSRASVSVHSRPLHTQPVYTRASMSRAHVIHTCDGRDGRMNHTSGIKGLTCNRHIPNAGHPRFSVDLLVPQRQRSVPSPPKTKRRADLFYTFNRTINPRPRRPARDSLEKETRSSHVRHFRSADVALSLRLSLARNRIKRHSFWNPARGPHGLCSWPRPRERPPRPRSSAVAQDPARPPPRACVRSPPRRHTCPRAHREV